MLGFVGEDDLERQVDSLTVAVRAPVPGFDLVQSFLGTAAYAEQEAVENAPSMGCDGSSEPHHRTDGLGSSLLSPTVQVLASLEIVTTGVPEPSQLFFDKARVANGLIQ